MSSGRLQKKSMPVLLSSSSMVMTYFARAVPLSELYLCSIQNAMASYFMVPFDCFLEMSIAI